MSMQIQNFISEVAINSMIHRGNSNRLTELNTIAAALATDPTTYDTTMQSAPVALRPGLPTNSKFTNDILALVNIGKASNLTPLAMGNAITSSLSLFIPPVNTAIPAITGTGTVGQTLTCTTGTWTYSPTNYTYQWMRGAMPIGGATASTYLLVAADSGTSLTCQLTAYNAAGSTMVTSGSKAVA